MWCAPSDPKAQDPQAQPDPTPIWDSNLIWERIQKGELVRIWSRVLSDWVLWVRDENVRIQAMQEFPHLASYTVTELEHLVRIRSEVHLRAVHDANQFFGSGARLVGSEKVDTVKGGV